MEGPVAASSVNAYLDLLRRGLSSFVWGYFSCSFKDAYSSKCRDRLSLNFTDFCDGKGKGASRRPFAWCFLSLTAVYIGMCHFLNQTFELGESSACKNNFVFLMCACAMVLVFSYSTS